MLAPSVVFSTTTPIISAPQNDAPPKVVPSLQMEVETLAQEYHQDPVLAMNIITCESKAYGATATHKNIDSKGNWWSTDWGPWQINDYYHEARAKSLGLNIYDTEDNLRYGFILMSEQGTKPWSASKYCWSKK